MMLPQPNLEILAADSASSLLGKEAIPRLTVAAQDLSSSRLGLAHALFCDGQLAQAWQELSYALEENPELAQAYHIKGVMLAASNRLEEAIEPLELTVELDPASHQSYLLLGQTLEKLGRLDRALNVVDRLLRLNSSLAEAHALRGDILCRLGRTAEAVDAYRQSCLHDALQPLIRLKLAKSLCDCRRLEEALTELLTCQQQAPSNNDILLAFADLLRDCYRDNEAAEIYRLALIQSPLKAVLYARLGQYFLRQKRITAAIGLLRTAVTLDPKLAEAYKSLGEIYQTLGYLAESEQMIATANRIGREQANPSVPTP